MSGTSLFKLSVAVLLSAILALAHAQSAPAAKPASKTEPAKTAAMPPAEAAPAARSGANTFNRLMKPAGKRNLPPAEDGIHDPTNENTHDLQAPLEAFADLPKALSGNRVNWVKAQGEGKVTPRFDLKDPKADPVVMDLDIVREVKGTMPDVIFPHKQHTEILDCSNCHPAPFVPQKGANQMSMAAMMLGQQCGVCHGKVAFTMGECRLCHNKPKPTKTAVKK